MRLGCKPICIIDRQILGRASLALLNQTGCCRGLLRSAPRSLCMNSWTYGAPLSIVSACPLQSFTFDIGFALSLPVPPYNAPSSTPHDRGPWTVDHDERRTTGQPIPNYPGDGADLVRLAPCFGNSIGPLAVCKTRRHDNHNAEQPGGSSCLGLPTCPTSPRSRPTQQVVPAARSAKSTFWWHLRPRAAEALDVTLHPFGPREYLPRSLPRGCRRLTGPA